MLKPGKPVVLLSIPVGKEKKPLNPPFRSICIVLFALPVYIADVPMLKPGKPVVLLSIPVGKEKKPLNPPKIDIDSFPTSSLIDYFCPPRTAFSPCIIVRGPSGKASGNLSSVAPIGRTVSFFDNTHLLLTSQPF
eukprot:gene23366-30627_t